MRTRSRGFGLLEAIVAMAILGSAGLLLFGWIQSNLETASRLREAEARARLQLEVQGWVAKLNPMQQPSGEWRLADIEIRWESRLIEPERNEFDYGGGVTTTWRLGLYELEVSARQGEVRESWRQVVAGWRSNFARAAP